MELSQKQFQEQFMEKAAEFMQDLLDIVNKVWPAPVENRPPHTNGETKKRTTREVDDDEEEEIEEEVQKTPEKKKPEPKKPEETKKKRAKKDSTTPSGGGDDVCVGRFWLNPPLPCILVEEGRSTEGIELNTAQKFPGAAGKCKICKECGKKRKNFKQSERTRKKKEQKQNEQTN